MLGLLFIGDLGPAHFSSTRRKCEAQRIFACFVQVHSQCSAANTNQLNYRIINPNHWKNCFKKTNQIPFIQRLKYSVVSVLKLLTGSLCDSVMGVSSQCLIW